MAGILMKDITDLDCVATTDFKALEAAVAVDARNLDVAWVILCTSLIFFMQVRPPASMSSPRYLSALSSL
jgi:hypothetical protein